MCNQAIIENGQARIKFGDAKLDNQICGNCGHYFALHRAYGCHYSYEQVNECKCTLSRDAVEARYWAIKMREERDEAKRLLEYYIGWINANRND